MASQPVQKIHKVQVTRFYESMSVQYKRMTQMVTRRSIRYLL